MPTVQGCSWTYSAEIQRQVAGQPPQTSTADVTYKIDAVKKEGDTTRFQLGIYQNDKKRDEQNWRIDPKGIFQVSIGPKANPFTPPQPVVAFPAKLGVVFDWDGTSSVGGRRQSSKLKGQITGEQLVDTELGSVMAYLIETGSESTIANGKSVTITSSYMRPGVGIVRYKQESRTAQAATVITLRLKDYTIKEAS